ncbi:MAG: squalene/phytoene synthase family protein [Ferruginibacter sp.]
MIQLFHELSNHCSRLTTAKYSTSFSTAIKLLHKDLQVHVHNIYGMVRFADEIVDSFHGYEKELLLLEFKDETYRAIERRISLNPILHSFQFTVNKYQIDSSLIEAFFCSMQNDLYETTYNVKGYNQYIFGSAEAVGLMCLSVFCEEDVIMYNQLKPYARALGAAFQKVNFLRDVKQDREVLHRTYFPGVDFNNFTPGGKKAIEADIMQDFSKAYKGIILLPVKARFGVYVAYTYYLSLFKKIIRITPAEILAQRVRLPNYSKALIVMRAGIRSQLNIL